MSLRTMANADQKSELSAEYISSTGQKTFTSPLLSATAATRSTADKTAYLSDLRAKVTQLQQDINTFLTAKMEEDRAADEAAGVAKTNAAEDKEEDMYGEEDPENDS